MHKLADMPQPLSLRPAGAHIRALRRRAGIKPGAFAESVGISYSHLANVENGHHRGVSPEVLNRIATALGVEIEELIDTPSAERDRPPNKPPEPTGPSGPPNKPGIAVA